jgi:predicted RNase H-like HicB family nuclease
MKSIRLTAELIPEPEGGFTVYCPELDICTQGDTETESLDNLREAAQLHLTATPSVGRRGWPSGTLTSDTITLDVLRIRSRPSVRSELTHGNSKPITERGIQPA